MFIISSLSTMAIHSSSKDIPLNPSHLSYPFPAFFWFLSTSPNMVASSSSTSACVICQNIQVSVCWLLSQVNSQFLFCSELTNRFFFQSMIVNHCLQIHNSKALIFTVSQCATSTAIHYQTSVDNQCAWGCHLGNVKSTLVLFKMYLSSHHIIVNLVYISEKIGCPDI